MISIMIYLFRMNIITFYTNLEAIAIEAEPVIRLLALM